MASVAVTGHHHRHSRSIGSPGLAAASAMSRGPVVEMMPNPDFSFPALPRAPSGTGRRPVSMHLNAPSPSAATSHRRAVSTLPSFTFNAADASGLVETGTPPLTPEETETDALTPSRRGHRREGSQFVGGDSRFGVSGAISSSPTKSSGFSFPATSSAPPAGRRGHAHKRSKAMSINETAGIILPTATETEPRLSSSLPATPFDLPAQAPVLARTVSEPLELTTDTSDAENRPPSRRVVGFKDDVEYIPRPLSTISSDTEGSQSTVRGHSVNNSISSVLSMSTPSPPSMRHQTSSLSTTFEHESIPRTRSSLEISKRVEKEGEWLKGRPSLQNPARPYSESAATSQSLTFQDQVHQGRSRSPHNKKHSLSHALRLDRRRSEPFISSRANELSRPSSISLQDDAKRIGSGTEGKAPRLSDRKTSGHKIKQWAASKIGKRGKELGSSSDEMDPPRSMSQSADDVFVAGKVSPAEVETDLDAVFSSSSNADEPVRLSTPTQPRIEMNTSIPSQSSFMQSRENDDASQMVDLDAALGPFKTPSLGGLRQRRELHSSRLTRDFGGPGMHYHRRAESLPALPAFEFRGSTPSSSSMDDVLEDDEEELSSHDRQFTRSTSSQSARPEVAGIGIQIVDADHTVQGLAFAPASTDDLRSHRDSWQPERPSTSHGTLNPRLSTPILERRPSSIIEETIIEESSPIEALEIVEAHEEPRASSLTKSSDSSETPTLLATQADVLTIPDGQQSLMTPDTYQTSTFSSPDFGRRQSSFDTSRLGTSASSIADNRTMSSYTTSDQAHDLRMSVDDPVPSLTSSRSTMMSTMHANSSRRDFSNERTSSMASANVDAVVASAAGRTHKRASIQSLSQLVGGSFGSSKSKVGSDSRPQTAFDPSMSKLPKKKEHRLKKLMFWKSKNQSKQSLHD